MNREKFLKLAQRWLFTFIIAVFAADKACGQSNVAAMISIQMDQSGVRISSNLFGIFFEEINSAGNGGIYAEMLGPWSRLIGAVGPIRIPESDTQNFNRLAR
jgi:hypothetical protein